MNNNIDLEKAIEIIHIQDSNMNSVKQIKDNISNELHDKVIITKDDGSELSMSIKYEDTASDKILGIDLTKEENKNIKIDKHLLKALVNNQDPKSGLTTEPNKHNMSRHAIRKRKKERTKELKKMLRKYDNQKTDQ